MMLKPMQSACATLRIALAVLIGLSVSSWNRAERVSAQATEPNKARTGACEREAEKLTGQKTVRIGGAIRAPKQLREVSPNYPKQSPGTVGTGAWIGEALVNSSGEVVKVWTIRDVTFTPAFPAFNNAIVDDIHRREYEPVIVDGKPSPFCLTVSVQINWR
jgi:hypothetical protein